jgi:hypothetical protein
MACETPQRGNLLLLRNQAPMPVQSCLPNCNTFLHRQKDVRTQSLLQGGPGAHLVCSLTCSRGLCLSDKVLDHTSEDIKHEVCTLNGRHGLSRLHSVSYLHFFILHYITRHYCLVHYNTRPCTIVRCIATHATHHVDVFRAQ